MTPTPFARDRLRDPLRMLVVGMGVTNQAVAAAMTRRGHTVVAVDDSPSPPLRESLAGIGVEFVEAPDRERLTELVVAADVVIPTPGLPETHAVFAAAEEVDRPVVGELDLAAAYDDRPIIAVTGTNGKTTVVEIVVDALRRAGRTAVAAGNTDLPLITAIDDPATDEFVVEASSFRLAPSRWFAPSVATWLNYAPDHLDVHRDLDSYEAAKAAIWARLPTNGIAVANAADPVVMAHRPADRAVATFGTGADYRVGDGDAAGLLVGPDGPFLAIEDLWRSLPHDIDNALAVAATVVAAGADIEAAASACRAFTGLAHRVALVARLDGSDYYDDSKATTPHATAAALSGFDRVVLIAGGRNKGIDLAPLAGEPERVAAVVAIGEAAAEVAAVFGDRCVVETGTDMSDAVERARRLAAAGIPVLLSPGCASFDWYRSYAERGDDFARIVRALVDEQADRTDDREGAR